MAPLAAGVWRGVPLTRLELGIISEELTAGATDLQRLHTWQQGGRAMLGLLLTVPIARCGLLGVPRGLSFLDFESYLNSRLKNALDI